MFSDSRFLFQLVIPDMSFMVNLAHFPMDLCSLAYGTWWICAGDLLTLFQAATTLCFLLYRYLFAGWAK